MGETWRYRIRDARLAKNLTQSELAHMLEVPRAFINGIETGLVLPSDAMSRAIAEILNINTEGDSDVYSNV